MIDELQKLQEKRMSRRGMLYGIGGLGATLGMGTTLTGCPAGVTNLDTEILNFALNLEYLEAEFYLRAIGETLDQVGDNPGPVTGGSEVNFERSYWEMYAREIAENERQHVVYLRNVLGADAVDRPAIDFTNAFDAAGQAAGLGSGFDPFADQRSFLYGAFVFEDLGVTAYKGGAPLITNPGILEAAAGILAVEAYHAAMIRTTIWNIGDPDVTINLSTSMNKLANGNKDHTVPSDAISDARDSLDGPSDIDQPILVDGMSNITPTDSDGIAYSRSVSQVLNIAYLNADSGVSSGGFFPEGVNNTDTAFTTT